MPGQIRSNLKAAKIAYKIKKTPKDKQQNPDKRPSNKLLREWFKDSSQAQ